MEELSGIKSKERVQEHGEVFTPDSIVNDMLDLVDEQLKGKDDTEQIKSVELMSEEELKKYIDYTYLEPACGNGNFLIRILDRKLQAVQLLPKEQQELWLIHAISSIYGVDIQKDNVDESKERMIELIKNGTINVLELTGKEKLPWNFEKIDLSNDVEKVIKFILDKNIQHGDCLTGKKHTLGGESSEDLLITEYTWNGTRVKRREIPLNNCIQEGNIMYDVAEHEYPDTEYSLLVESHNTSSSSDDDEEYDF